LNKNYSASPIIDTRNIVTDKDYSTLITLQNHIKWTGTNPGISIVFWIPFFKRNDGKMSFSKGLKKTNTFI